MGDFVQVIEGFPLGHFLGTIEALAAFTTTVRSIRQEEEDPKFQKASALGAVDVLAATQRTIPLFGVHKQA